ncbi:MAG: pyruvate dehydrogenase [delta proteobacterium ML8_F1]|nr:MAG: pyruvate dehydrogenase [delta proteobacterium ML8_F1]
MREITFSQATLEAMKEEMQRDDTIFVMGEDIARQGGIFGQFKGLPDDFGTDRIIDTPISETAIIGSAIGAALAGMRPVADMHFADFMGITMDEVFNQMAKIRYMFGGQTKIPMVIRAPDGLIRSGAAQHSQSIEAWFNNIPGIKVVAPSNPSDAKGLLKAAIRSDDPIIYFENKDLYRQSGPVSEEEELLVEIGKAKVARAGTDVTIVSYSVMMNNALEAAEILEKEGYSVEVIDLITLSPFDEKTVIESVKKTHRLLIAHEAVKKGGLGGEVAAVVAEEAIDYLDAPIIRVGAKFTPVPFSPTLEEAYRPKTHEIVDGIRSMFI